MTTSSAPDWYPDPYGRHEYRYFDGEAWTENASSHGKEMRDPVTDADVKGVVGKHRPDKVQGQVQKAQDQAAKRGSPTPGQIDSGGTLFTEPILVVNQKAKLIEINNEYAIYDQNGNQLGAIRQVGQSKLKKAARFLTSVDQFMTHKLQVVDMANNVLMSVTRPAKFIKSRVIIEDATGTELGQVLQNNVFGKINFSLQANGVAVGSINAENWRAWNFNIQDASGTQVARITKTWEGFTKTLFTTADNYVIERYSALEDPLLTLVIASALSVDTALKQDSRGFG